MIPQGIQKNFYITLIQIYGAVKGITGAILVQAALPLFFFHNTVSTSTFQSYSAIAEIPWCLQALVAVISHKYPIAKHYKKYYIYIALGIITAAFDGLLENNKRNAAITAYVFASLGYVIINTLYNGAIAELVAFYNTNQSVISHTTAFSLIGNIIGAIIVGSIQNLNIIFTIAIIIIIQAAITTIAENAIPNDDVIITEKNDTTLALITVHGNSPKKYIKNISKTEAYAIAWITASAAFFLACLSLQYSPITFIPVIIVASITFINFLYKDNTPLKYTTAYIFIMEIVCTDIEPILNAMYTADDACFINGPNFSLFFYITIISSAVAISGIAAAAIMASNYKLVNARSLIQIAIAVKIAAVIPDIVILKNWAKNYKHTLYFFDNGIITPFATTIIFITHAYIITTLFNTKGKASISYNIIFSFAALGKIISKSIGLFYAQHIFNIHAERNNNACNFDNIIQLIIWTNAISPLLAIALAYISIPNINIK